MNPHQTNNAQLRYLPSAQPQSLYSTPPNQAYPGKYVIKRPRFEDGSSSMLEEYEDESPYRHHPQPVQPAFRPTMATFQIRHRSTDKTRGLRHFAHKVCEKVKEKGQTNYNEVAEELVTEYFDQLADIPQDPEKYQYDVRNIRRRVYDALNVLMAMNIIEKEKKEIRWVGLPTSSLAECRRLEEEKTQRQERIRQKTEQLQELIVQLVAYKSLVQRNRERERQQGRPPNSAILYLPYIIVSTDKKTMVECAIAPNKSEYWFNFDRPFEIHDDIEVLKRLGLAYGIDRGEVLPENVQHIKTCLPPALRDYVDQILEGTLIQKRSEKATSSRALQPIPQSLVKLDPHSNAIRATPADSIVVRATRANLSGVAPTGDGGPLGSFLTPMNPVMAGKVHPNNVVEQQAPIARYAVIPRPLSARYSSSTIPRYLPPQPTLSAHQSQHQYHPYAPNAHQSNRLGGVLHYEAPREPPTLFHPRQRATYGREEERPEQMMMAGGAYSTGPMSAAGQGECHYLAAEEYINADGEEGTIIEEEVVTEEQV